MEASSCVCTPHAPFPHPILFHFPTSRSLYRNPHNSLTKDKLIMSRYIHLLEETKPRVFGRPHNDSPFFMDQNQRMIFPPSTARTNPGYAHYSFISNCCAVDISSSPVSSTSSPSPSPSPSSSPSSSSYAKVMETVNFPSSTLPLVLESAHKDRESQASFVNWFREAWPYVRGHQGSTFVLIISSEIIDSPSFDGVCQDLSLLHGLGIKLVIIPGTHLQIDKLLYAKGHKPYYAGSYRITDDAALEASMEVAGKFRLGIEAKLSCQPSIPVLRRHGDNDRWHVGVSVASGNFVAAKRRGVVDGIDYRETGEVRRLDVARIKKRLDDNCIVILSNLGYSSAGEVLNCNTYEVATACAVELQADKLISLIDGPFLDENGRSIRFMTLQGADRLIRKWAEQSETAANYVKAVGGINYVKSLGLESRYSKEVSIINGSMNNLRKSNRMDTINGNGDASQIGQGLAIGGQERLSREYGYLSELTAAVFVCRGGVRRVHLLDATVEGVLLLELYTRDGIGTMVASDRYEGTRPAQMNDVPRIEELLRPLEERGVLIKRTREQLLGEVSHFIVVERDASIIACGALFPFHNEKCAEIAALAVSDECRGHGQGDKLLDYMENKAVNMGIEKLFLLTTRTADWFVRRGFSECSITCIPRERQAKIDLARGSKYYIKTLMSSGQDYAGLD